jgi:hypothetical protein
LWFKVRGLAMNRREFIILAGGVATSAPLAAMAQQQYKLGLLETRGDTPFLTVPFTRKLEIPPNLLTLANRVFE